MQMKVAEWMTKKVVTAKPLDSILRTRETLIDKRVNQLPVVAGGELVGIITDRDLRDAFPSVFDEAAGRRITGSSAKGDPAKVTVEMVMTATPFTIGPSAGLAEAAEVMRRERVGALPVVENGQLVGVLTRSDLLRALVQLETR
jgi:acetoin utilization protein AcuB